MCRFDSKSDKHPVNMKFYNWYLEVIRKQPIFDLADDTSKSIIPRGDLLPNYYIEYFPIELSEN